MSRKAMISGSMIVDAAYEITRIQGFENVNVRSIAAEIGCTTQPILYHFSSITEIKDKVHDKADEVFGDCLSDLKGYYRSPMIEMGMQYIKFAAEEKELFKLLFQSDKYKYERKSFDEILVGDDVVSLINFEVANAHLSKARAKNRFTSLYFTAHGIASMIANNSMEYDEKQILKIMNTAYDSADADVKDSGTKVGKWK